jgi:NADH dehydrogenase FAD-containing subunit
VLISNQKSLFPDLPEKFGRSLLEKLKAMRVEVVLDQSAENLNSLDTPYAGTLTLSDGQRIEADLIFPVIGAWANSELLATLPDVEIGRANRAKVDAWLRPSSKMSNVFAAGDVSENGDLMTIVALAKQVPWLKKVFLSAINRKSIESMKPYAPWKKNHLSLFRWGRKKATPTSS